MEEEKKYIGRLRNFFDTRYGKIKFRLMDLNCLIYFGLIGFLLIFFHNNINQWQLYILIHIGIIFGILEINRAHEKYQHLKILRFIRIFYPIALILFGWSEINALIRMFYNNHWGTAYVIRLEKSIFGMYPTLWFQQFLRPWLDEIMNIFYDTYFLFMPIVGFTLFFKKKYAEALAAFSIGTAVHFSNFIIFYLFPTLGPQEIFVELQPLKFTGYFFGELTRILQANGSVKGGAFPSSHVSAALAWSLVAIRYEKKLGYILLPFSFGVGFATVYLGYHYALDPICGYLWCLIIYPIALKILKKRGEEPLSSSSKDIIR